MKKGGYRHWKAIKYSCPRCGAAPGVSCYSNGYFFPVCLERHMLDPDANRLTPGTLAKTSRPGIRGEASKACQHYHHGKCTGQFRLNHGLGMKKCGCLCHKKEE